MKARSTIEPLSEKNNPYRLQVINVHCLKKVAVEGLDLRVSATEAKKSAIGEGLALTKV